jgi:hypothetical protein
VKLRFFKINLRLGRGRSKSSRHLAIASLGTVEGLYGLLQCYSDSLTFFFLLYGNDLETVTEVCRRSRCKGDSRTDLPLLDLLSSIRTNFCCEPGKSTANSVSTLPRSLRLGLMCFMLNTKLSFFMTSSTWRLASEIETFDT